MIEANYGSWRGYFASWQEFESWLVQVNYLLLDQGKVTLTQGDFDIYNYCAHEAPDSFLIILNRISKGLY